MTFGAWFFAQEPHNSADKKDQPRGAENEPSCCARGTEAEHHAVVPGRKEYGPVGDVGPHHGCRATIDSSFPSGVPCVREKQPSALRRDRINNNLDGTIDDQTGLANRFGASFG